MSSAVQKSLFLVAGLYDLLIGLVFLVGGRQLLESAGVLAPNHWGYLQFAACELIIFGLMFLSVSRDPVGKRELIVYGLLLKVSYVSLTGYYWTIGECPLLFQPFAVIDAVMFALFLAALFSRPAVSSTTADVAKSGSV
jgi:hypothetical protein